MYAAACLLLLLIFGRPHLRAFSLKYLLLGVGAANVCAICFIFSLSMAEDATQTMQVGMVNYLWPCLTIVFAVLFNGERARWWIVPGVLLSLLGVMVVLGGEDGFNPVSYTHLGVKIALGDHRCSFPSMEEVRSIVADVRVAGMLTGKTGFVHVHLGDYTSSFDIFDGIVASGLPIKHIRPTHVARHPAVFERAMGFAKQGGWIDITTGGGNYMGCAADAYDMAVENGVPVNRITMSSDGHGSMPRFNEAGEMVGLGVGSIMCNIETVQELARRHDLTTALLPMTRTVAEALTLEGKGVIEVGADADLLILNAEHEITDVFMGGVQCMRAGEVIVKGAFEE